METGNENWKRKLETEMGTKDAPITAGTRRAFLLLQPSYYRPTFSLIACSVWSNLRLHTQAQGIIAPFPPPPNTCQCRNTGVLIQTYTESAGYYKYGTPKVEYC